MEDRMVVSDGGAVVPEHAAASHRGKHRHHQLGHLTAAHALKARGRAMGIQIAKVPQEEPVAKAITAATMKMTRGQQMGVSSPG